MPLIPLFIAVFILLSLPGQSQGRLSVDRLPDLPNVQGRPNPGVAGAFAGVSNGALLVAGGANFPNGYPWQNGKKVWHATVYVLNKPDGSWKMGGQLPRPLGYGTSVSWNNRLIGIGGNDAERSYADVFSLTWNPATETIQRDSLPPLPKPLANLAAAVLDYQLVVVGGESEHGAENQVYTLNLRNPAKGWQKRANLPGPGRAYTTLVAMNRSLYVVGGRQTRSGVTTVFADAYEYRLDQNRWHGLPDLPQPLAAHGAGSDGRSLWVIGGDNGQRLKQIEALNNRLKTLPDGSEAESLTRQRNELQRNHPGFVRTVWQYRLEQGRWSKLDTLAFPVPVTTPVVGWENGLVLPSGEVSPGVRTPAVWRLTIPDVH
ncbi:N-acetylneuraminic acid mutarotase [Larkinella arboricola]|uniref:N-acetylneuraminic acid mutarotase n=1 Tax=Larkinella arboricola TaxID=643671 RepID=A0A327X0B6_LARAB|nr:kelch repeat-containing protein [Larkinella arboricola]RAJ99900.1 N-acetylneuraminic acid mutarotase [Larkinella arboricola]